MVSKASVRSLTSLLALGLAAAACSSADDPTLASDKAEVTDEARSAFGLRDTKIVGSLTFGETSAPTRYTRVPRYRAFKFAANAGDNVDVWVRSANGDPVTWILDNDWRVVARNDDASQADTDSHIQARMPANASATHYIVVRDYDLRPMKFTVSLKGGPTDFVTGCATDSDCVKVDRTCCSNLGAAAVLASKADAYRASLACAEFPICPMVALRPDYSAALCNFATHTCELVQPADIVCNAFVAPSMQHSCPSGYRCDLNGSAPDAGGRCAQFCGGIAGFPCRADDEECVDDPSDSCDPNAGGADCGGICRKK